MKTIYVTHPRYTEHDQPTHPEHAGRIRAVWQRYGYLLDPHAAIAWLGLREVLATEAESGPGVFLATAHPAKFREVVEPAIGQSIPLPPPLAEAIKRPRHSEHLRVDYPILKKLLLAQSR